MVSGLVGLVPLEELRGSKVIMVCNMKPVGMRGKTSHHTNDVFLFLSVRNKVACYAAGCVKVNHLLFDCMCLNFVSSAEHTIVEPLRPPSECKAGDIVQAEGYEHATCGSK